MFLYLALGCWTLGLIEAQAIYNNINDPNYNVNSNPNYNVNSNPNYNVNNNPNYNFNNNPNYNTNNNIHRFGNDIFYDQLRCPEHWVQFQQSCYRFIKSPLRPYNDARRLCQVCTAFSYIPLYFYFLVLKSVVMIF